jgi:ribosomal protein S12 methylthiotransferase accessory factor
LLVADDRIAEGWGTSLTVDISISRAFSEALQSLATVISGAREDGDQQLGAREQPFFVNGQPSERTLHVHDFRRRVSDRKFSSLSAELAAAVRWVRDAGYSDILIANLTRHGVDIPVVKVVVPGMDVPRDLKATARSEFRGVVAAQYPTVHAP